MNKSAQTRLPQTHLDKICDQRLKAKDFAKKQTFIQKIITTIKGANT